MISVTHFGNDAAPTSGAARSREPLYLFVGTYERMTRWMRSHPRIPAADVVRAASGRDLLGRTRPVVFVIEHGYQQTEEDLRSLDHARAINVGAQFRGRTLYA